MSEIQVHDVRALPGDSAFLIDDGQSAILYDSGFAFTGCRVADKIRSHLFKRGLDCIFLTHSHYDHALGAAYVKGAYPMARIVAGSYAAGIFKKPSAKAVMRDLDGKFARKNGVFDYEDRIDQLAVDIPVEDGDRITVGNMEFCALNLPGHTKCSVAYYCEREGLLLGCETLGVYNGKDDVVPSYLVGYQMALRAIERVEGLAIERILVPHYGLLDKEQTRFYLKKAKQSAVETAESIVQMLRNGRTAQDAVAYYKERFYHGYIREIYPIDAMELNTKITVELLRREFGLDE